MPVERVEEQGRDVIAFASLTVFAAAMYVVPGEWIPGAQSLRIALLSSSLALGLMLVRRLSRMEPVQGDGLRGFALVAFAALATASVLWSVNPEVSRGASLELLKLVAIYFTLVNVVTTWKRLAIIAGALVLGSIVTSVGVIHWYQTGVDLSEGFRARWLGVYYDPNHMAMDLGLVVPLAVAFVARKSDRWFFRIACAVAAVLAVVAIVLSHSRGGFIGLSIAMAFWAFREKRRLQALVVGAVFVAGLFVFAPKSFWDRNETVANFQEDASAMGRVYAWQVASKISIDRPLLGVGLGSFRYAWPLYAPAESHRAYVAHNVFLDVIGELGFVGLLFFLIFAGGAVGGAYQGASDPEYGWLARAIGSAVTGYLVCDLFSGYIISSHLYVLFGLGACAERIARSASREIILSRSEQTTGPVFVQA